MNINNKVNLEFEIEMSLKVLNDSIRMALLFVILRKKEASVEYLRECLNLKGNTIYYHLKLLEQTRLLSYRKEPVKDTNLFRKLYYVNEHFWEWKADPKWHEIVKQNMKTAFMIEMYLAVASLMEAIQKLHNMSEEKFKELYKDQNPQIDVLFMKKAKFKELQTIINNFIKEEFSEDFSEILKKSEGYIYSIFAYPPI